ncbi:protocadherin-9 [Biomphalaria glabrata]|nr:protocadherin-9 [Biomphalaria glabrata]
MNLMILEILTLGMLFSSTNAQLQDVVFTQPEEQSAGQFVGSVATSPSLTAFIGDTDRASLRYNILSDSGNKNGDLFRIDPFSGNVTFGVRVDKEKACPTSDLCELNFAVAVTGSSNFFTRVAVKVVITDINDNSPTFKDSSMDVHISEAAPVGSSFSLSPATDLDLSAENGVSSYGIEPESDTFKLAVIQNQVGTSQVYLVTKQNLDRETIDSYKLIVVAKDGGTPQRSGTLTVNVVVDDFNDNSPVFSSTIYAASFNETAGTGYNVLTVSATDLDTGDNGKVIYSLSTFQPPNKFDLRDKIDVNSTSGVVFLKKPLPSGEYQVLIDARDLGYPQRFNQSLLKISVLDTENSQPILTLTPVPNNDLPAGWVPEVIAGAGTVVAVLTVDDPDSGQNGIVVCSSLEPNFLLQQLGPGAYKLTLAGPLDRERNGSFSVTVICQDHGTPSLNGTASIVIHVWDMNDNKPIFGKSTYTASIIENNLKSDTVLVVNALDADEGENARIEYRLADDDGSFIISASTGVIKANKVFDYEEASRYEFTVLAMDNGNPRLTGSASVVVTIRDINDVAPKFSQDLYMFQIYENRERDSIVGNFTVTDPDTEEGGVITLSLQPKIATEPVVPFTVTKDGRVLSLEKFDREMKSLYSFYIVATDNGQRRLSSSVLVTVNILDENDNKPEFVFPGNQNFSAFVDIPIFADTVILKIEAQDPDEGKNAALIYSLSESNASDLFRIARVSGELMPNRNIVAGDIGTYAITINVTDQGYPALWSTRVLLLVVQSGSEPSTGKVIADQNVLIVACIICFTVIVSGAVLVAICVLKRQDHQRKYASSRRDHVHASLDGRQQYDLAITSVKDPTPSLDLNSSFQQQNQQPKSHKGNGNSLQDPSNVSIGDKMMNIPGSSSGQVFLAKTAITKLPETNAAKHDDFHSTSSNETSTGDSGHGSDEDMSNSMEQTNMPSMAVEHAVPLAITAASRQSVVRASFPQQNRAQRPSLSKSPPRAKNSTVRFDPHVSYDNIPPLRSPPPALPSQIANRSNIINNNGSNSAYSQPMTHKYDLVVRQNQQHPPQHQLHAPHPHSNLYPPQRPYHADSGALPHLPSQNSKARLSAVYPTSPQKQVAYRPASSSVGDDLDDDSDLNTTTSGSYSIASDDVARLNSLGEIKDMFV